MEEKQSTNPVSSIVRAILKSDKEQSILFFEIGNGYSINLNSEQCQSVIKEVFSALLVELLSKPIEIKLEFDPEFKPVLYVDACKFYIEDLNNELQRIRASIPAELQK